MMPAKLPLKFATATAVVLSISNTCAADTVTGKVTTYYLNQAAAKIGACIRLSVPLPHTNGLVCTTDDASFQPINDLLRDAYLWGKTCQVDYTGIGGGTLGGVQPPLKAAVPGQISSVECL